MGRDRRGTGYSDVTARSVKCQVVEPEHDELVCPAYDESNGYRCERTAPHGDDDHWVSAHTIRHSIAGSGFTCDRVDEAIAAAVIRALLHEA